MRIIIGVVRLLSAVVLLSQMAVAQTGPFQGGWTLQAGASALNFQSVKNVTKVETSGFATFSGTIDESGAVRIAVLLDSIDTKVDLRNVRMRFLMFETFQFPEAVITAQLDPAALADLPQIRRKQIPLTYSVTMHGVSKTFDTVVTATLLTDDLVAVSSGTPISVAADDFGMSGGVQKLEEAANVAIIPSATVSFDFMFARNVGGAAPVVAAVEPAPVALEAAGDFDLEACKGRFEILSRANSIVFTSGSAKVDPQSVPFLDQLVDIVTRCPGLTVEVSGHTDSDGRKSWNQTLSEQRAAAVSAYLAGKGIDTARVVSVGYGPDKPVFPNDSLENKARNLRIEFAVVNG